VLKLYHAPLTRSIRIRWLLEELGLPYELATLDFVPPSTPFTQQTPTGKYPTLEDGEVVMFESGAILEYVLERYGKGRLAPAVGTPARAAFLQWVHFAEASVMPPIGQLAWNLIFKSEAERNAGAIADARRLATVVLGVVERALAGKDYLLGADFSGADIMMGYGLQSARGFGVLGDAQPGLGRYLARLEARPALERAMS
jgi:glutathione S-transferase